MIAATHEMYCNLLQLQTVNQRLNNLSCVCSCFSSLLFSCYWNGTLVASLNDFGEA